MARESARDHAFRAYVEGERTRLVRTASLLAAGDRHLAEDLVQTALTRLYVSWPRVRAGSRDAYVHRILVNALVDEKRRRRRRPETTLADVPERAAPHDERTAESGVVHQALLELPPGMRAAVILRHWCDYDVAATARALGCTESNVKSQTARGLDRLRARLTEQLTTRRN